MSCTIFYNGREQDKESLGNITDPKVPRPMQRQILKQSKKIVRTEKEDGGHDYTWAETNESLRGISDEQKGEVGRLRHNPEEREISWEEKLANTRWGKRDKTERLDTEEGFLTWDEFVKKRQGRTVFGKDKGNLYHAIMEYSFATKQSDRDAARAKMMQIKSERQIPDSVHDWLYTFNESHTSHGMELRNKAVKNVRYIAEHLMKTNIFDDLPADEKDRIIMEFSVGNPILGIAGTPDALVEHFDGYLSLFDFKAGANLNREFLDEPLRFGRRAQFTITDNPRHRYKLQMMLYALTIKLNNPDAKFRNISIIHMPDEFTMYRGNNRTKVEVEPYLGLLEAFYRSQPDIWARLEAELTEEQLNNLFDPKEYDAAYSPYISDDLASQPNSSPSKEYTRLVNEIARLSFVTSNDNDYLKGDKKELKKARKKLFKAMEQLEEISGSVGGENLTLEGAGLSFMETWFGNIYDQTDPYIKQIRKIKSVAEKAAREEFEKVNQEFIAKFRPVWEQYLRRKGKAFAEMPLIGNALNFTKYGDLYDFLYKEVKNSEGELIKINMNVTEEDFKKVGRPVSPEEKAFAKFLNDYYGEWFKPDGYFMKKSIRALNKEGKEVLVSPMEIQNGKLGNRRDQRGPFKWKSGWIPKFARTWEEVVGKGHPYNYSGRGSIAKEVFLRGLTWHYENTFDEWDNTDEMIPMKGLGGLSIDESLNYTLDANEHFTRFAKAAIYKKHMDNVYGFARATKLYLQMKSEQEEMPALQNNVEFIGHILDYQLLGKNQRRFGKGKFTKSRWFSIINGKDGKSFSVVKLIQTMKGLTSGALMWLSTGGGTANGIFAYISTLKAGLSGSIFKRKVLGTSSSVADFSLKDMLFAHKEYKNYIADSLNGTLYKNKAWLMMQKLGFMPSFNPFRENRNAMIGTRNKFLSKNSLYAFYSLPEEFVAMTIMIAQLRHLKMNVNGKMESFWDLYERVQTTDEQGNELWTIKWREDEDGNPIARGVIDRSKDPAHPDLQTVSELMAEEIDSMKYVYQLIHGGYRRDEHTRLEYFVLGSLFMQFRRYLPSILRNMFMSKGERALGKLENVDTNKYYYAIKDGEVIPILKEEWDAKLPELGPNATPLKLVEWRTRVSEGRFMLLFNILLSKFVGMKSIQNPKNAVTQFLHDHMSNLEDYKWSELSEQQRAIMLDWAITWGTWAAMYLGYLSLFSDADDDDEYKMYAERILKDYKQQYNIREAIRIGTQPPVSVKMTVNHFDALGTMMVAGMQYAAGNEEDALTKTDRLRGWTQFQNNTVFLKGARQTVRAYYNERDPDAFFLIPFRK
jgi:hypothetical protein